MAMTDICDRIGKLVGGCKFEGRYDLGPSEMPGSYKGLGLQETLDKFRRKTYVADVCIRCGKTIKRQ